MNSGLSPSPISLAPSANALIGTILRHDSKVTSYKIALLRAINDVVLAYPDVSPVQNPNEQRVAIPLRLLAEFWVAYYWPFMDAQSPIFQGPLSRRSGGVANDMAFRPDLTRLRQAWEQVSGSPSRPADGFFLVNDLRVPRRRKNYTPEFLKLYEQTLASIARTILMPIRYAGPEQWTVFPRPQKLSELTNVVAIPGARPRDLCLVCETGLWNGFRELSLWIEALAIHEWCLFSGRTSQNQQASGRASGQDLGQAPERGRIYELLTERPDNRRPMSWERNHVDILLLEGREFQCPWTHRAISKPGDYDLDHLIPISILPINELWNLVPADSRFNSHVKGNRLPSPQRLQEALPRLAATYSHYQGSQALSRAIHEDVRARFTGVQVKETEFPQALAQAVGQLVGVIRTARNLRQF